MNMAHEPASSQENAFMSDILNIGGNNIIAPYFGGDVRFTTTPIDESCLRRLLVTDPRDDLEAILSQKEELRCSACSWVYEGDDFTMWWESDQQNLFWLKGSPGKGKTMMTIAVIYEIQRRLKAAPTSKTTMAYYFCQASSDLSNNASSVLRGLIYFLVTEEKENLLPFLRDKYAELGESLFRGQNSFYSLWNLLLSILQCENLGRIYLVIDALDECEFGLPNLLPRILRLDARLGRKVKLFVSSRKDKWIESKICSLPRSCQIDLDDELEVISAVVNSYVDDKIGELQRLKGYDDELWSLVRHQLISKAEDTFLWVSLACQELAKPSVPLWKIIDKLEELPKGLIPLYDRMLLQVSELDRYCGENGLAVLRAVVVAPAPLHLEEIHLVACLDYQVFQRPQNVVALVESCGSFLMIRDEIVHLVHLSAKQFLADQARDRIFGDRKEPAIHAQIFDRCLEEMNNHVHMHPVRLNRSDTVNPIAEGRVSKKQLAKEHTGQATFYACSHWIYHFSQSNYRSPERLLCNYRAFVRFLVELFPSWLDVLDVLEAKHGISSAISSLIQTLQRQVALNDTRNDTLTVERKVFVLVTREFEHFCQEFAETMDMGGSKIGPSMLLFGHFNSPSLLGGKIRLPTWIKDLWFFDPPIECQQVSHIGDVRSSNTNSDWFFSEITMNEAYSTDNKKSQLSLSHKRLKFDPSNSVPHDDHYSLVAFSDDGRFIASWSSSMATLYVTDRRSQYISMTVPQLRNVNFLRFSSDSTKIISHEPEYMQVLETSTGYRLSKLLNKFGEPWSTAFSPDGTKLATQFTSDTIVIWSSENGSILETFDNVLDFSSVVIFSSDGLKVAVAVSTWEIYGPQEEFHHLASLHIHHNKSSQIMFSSDGNKLAASSHLGQARMWDLADHTVAFHSVERELIPWSHQRSRDDGAAEATKAVDLQVWDVSTGHCIIKTLISPSYSTILPQLLTTMDLDRLSPNEGRHLAVRKEGRNVWIFSGIESLICLPPDVDAGQCAIHESTIAFADKEGKLCFLEVDKSELESLLK